MLIDSQFLGRGYFQVIKFSFTFIFRSVNIISIGLESSILKKIYVFFFFVLLDGSGEVNWKGVAYYNRLIDYMIQRGMINPQQLL